MRADGGRHSGAGRAAPQGIALDADAERFRVSEHVRDRRGEIARGDRLARAGTVSQHEGVVSLVADRHGIGEAFVYGADIGKASTRGDDRKGRSGLPAKEEQARVRLCPLLRLLVVRVELVEDGLAAVHIVDHVIQPADHAGPGMADARPRRPLAGAASAAVPSPSMRPDRSSLRDPPREPRWLAAAASGAHVGRGDRRRDPDAPAPGPVVAADGGGRGRRRAARSVPGPRRRASSRSAPRTRPPARPPSASSSVADTPEAMLRLSPARIARLIFPVGFYRTKARVIRAISRDLIERFGGAVPDDLDALLTLKGVGRKTANLVVTIGFDKPGICVDIHVHRISNRLGFVRTKSPDQTELALRAKLPRRYWIGYNDLLVAFGQNVCRPLSPHCSRCPVARWCRRVGVGRAR